MTDQNELTRRTEDDAEYTSNTFIKGCFVIGDIHGDAYVFLETLRMAGVLDPLGGRLDDAIAFHKEYRDGIGQKDEDILLRLCDQHVKWRTGHSALVIFLGDILDNYRYGEEKGLNVDRTGCPSSMGDMSHHCNKHRVTKFARMAMHAEYPIVECILRLQKEAALEKGRIVWVLGNHDVGNVWNSTRCRRHTPVEFCDTTNTQRYSETRSTWVRNALLSAHAVAVCTLDNVLLCHGGISKVFVTQLQQILCIPEIKIRNINILYRNGITQSSTPPIWSSEYDITWFRPHAFDTWDRSVLTTLHGHTLTSMVVGHTMHASPMMINHEGSTQIYLGGSTSIPLNGSITKQLSHADMNKSEKILLDGNAISIDVGMSRAMNRTYPPYDSEEIYCLLLIMKITIDINTHDGHAEFIYQNHPRCSA
jgi:hypothetical protein